MIRLQHVICSPKMVARECPSWVHLPSLSLILSFILFPLIAFSFVGSIPKLHLCFWDMIEKERHESESLLKGCYDFHNVKVVFFYVIMIDCHIKLANLLNILSSKWKNHLLLSSSIVKATGVNGYFVSYYYLTKRTGRING